MKWNGWQTVQALIIGGVFTSIAKIFWDSWKDRE